MDHPRKVSGQAPAALSWHSRMYMHYWGPCRDTGPEWQVKASTKALRVQSTENLRAALQAVSTQGGFGSLMAFAQVSVDLGSQPFCSVVHDAFTLSFGWLRPSFCP